MLSVADVLELLGIPLLGVIPESKAVLQSSNKGTPAILDETTDVAQAYMDVVTRFLGEERRTASSRKRSAASSAACSANRDARSIMAFLDYFRRRPKIGVARQGSAADHRGARAHGHASGAPDYLPQLQQELLAVIARYEKIDLSCVTVNVDRSGGCEVLELNIALPEPPSPRGRRIRLSPESDFLVVTAVWARPWLTVVDRPQPCSLVS